MTTTLHAVYANTRARNGAELTLRVGLPTDEATAFARWLRLDNRRWGFEGFVKRPLRIAYARRLYTVDSLEMREVDYNGRGIGSERHATALPVPYRAMRSAVR